MRLYEIHDKEGRGFAFEIKDTFVSRQGVCWIASTIPGACVVRRPKWLFSWFREDVFCEFELDGVRFVAWEPYGDSDVYWIGPEPTCWVPRIDKVREVFSRA